VKIHHFGFLCKDIEKSLSAFQELGMKFKFKTVDELRQIEIVFLKSESGELIELISPISEDSVVGNLLKKHNNSFYHLGFLTNDLFHQVRELEKKGFILVIPPEESVAFNHHKVAFLFNQYLGIIELVESADENRLFK